MNDKNYFTEPDRGGGGRPTDFFGGKDEAFVKHKNAMASQIAEAALAIATQPGQVGIVKVTLREAALAKSHRPERALFKAEAQPCVGGADLGELYYITTSDQLIETLNKVAAAEDTTTWAQKYGSTDLEPDPSPERADTGSILRVDVPAPEDKRDFSAEAAVQWLNKSSTGGIYLIELFSGSGLRDHVSGRFNVLRTDFSKLLSSVDARFQTKILNDRTYAVRLAAAQDERATSPVPIVIAQDPVHHQAILDRLARHPLVRRISLPVLAGLSDTYPNSHLGKAASIAPKSAGVDYPKVGVIDTGMAAPMAPWTLSTHDFIDKADQEPDHGTFIGGLLTSARALNPSISGLENDGCDLVDIPLFPKPTLFSTFYPNGFSDFLDEMDHAIGEAVADHNVKVFNLSINAVQPVSSKFYSYYAERLDEISARHDVIIVNSAGNLPYAERRAPWPIKTKDVLSYFAARVEPDTIHQPSESHRTVAVGAVNPPGSKAHLVGVPTTYTRRGPGLRVGCKPDVAHYGGGEGEGSPSGCGLESVAVDGTLHSSCGTSYAAPLVAKTLATLQSRIASPLPSHALRALMIHSCQVPANLSKRGLGDLQRQFVGFGLPNTVDEMLFDDDHAITLVFSSVLPRDGVKPRGKVLRFPFSWPAALVDPITGACRGSISATLVSTPPVDRRFGAEMVRVNVEAAVQQRWPVDRKDGTPSFRDVLNKVFLPKDPGAAIPEKELIKQGMKWWPTKGYRRNLPEDGLGSSSQWQIEVSSLRRSQVDFPAEGIPFCLVVTITDPDRQAPVFQEMRRTLGTQLVQLGDLQTSLRVRQGGA